MIGKMGKILGLIKRQEEFQSLARYIEDAERRNKITATAALGARTKIFLMAFPNGEPPK